MSASSGGTSGSDRKTESTVTRGSSGTKKSVEEHFGSEVDIKIRSVTGSNPKVEKYFGSEVDLKLSSEAPHNLLAPIQDVDDASAIGDAPEPKKVDLAELDARPFKDATELDSIRKLEERLEEVKAVQTKVVADAEDAGKKVSAFLLAKVGEGDKKVEEEPTKKKSFLDKMMTRSKPKEEAKVDKPDKKEEKQVGKIRTVVFE